MYLTAANAAHLVQVEVEPETGQVSILGYWIADDCGTRLNPRVVEGQTQGALAQGIGASLIEEYVYDREGQRLSSTFMDYLLPTATDVPAAEKVAVTTPSPVTPLGVKGAGEGAIHTTPAALYCAVNDALSPLGVRLDELPMTPNRIWHATKAARAAGGTRPPQS
jgi:CO/xanthine dehydrogenase Mo-binding subunit